MDGHTAPGAGRSASTPPGKTRPNIRSNLADRPPRPVPGGLGADPRLPIWVLRAVLAVAAAIVVTVFAGWRLGLTAAVIVAVADTILRSRTTAVIPAATRVTWAQRRTRRRLLQLRASGYVALNARSIPDSDSIIDHLVVGPGGVFAIDSEMWDRRLPIRTTSSGMLFHGPASQRDRLEHANWEAGQAAVHIGKALGRDVRVRPAMVIYGPVVPWIVATLDGVDVFSGGRARKYFARQTRMSRGSRLDAEQVQEIFQAAAAALPPAH